MISVNCASLRVLHKSEKETNRKPKRITNTHASAMAVDKIYTIYVKNVEDILTYMGEGRLHHRTATHTYQRHISKNKNT